SLYKHTDQIAIGNIVGSNILNILLVLGLCSLVSPIHISNRVIRREVPIMVFVSVLLLVLALDGRINRWDGALLFSGSLVFVLWSLKEVRTTKSPMVLDESTTSLLSCEIKPTKASMSFCILKIVIGIALLVLGSTWIVNGAIKVADHYKVSELIISLTIISLGTSLPEIATSIVAGFHGRHDLAVGNIVGSNIFNILGTLGLACILSPVTLTIPMSVLMLDIPVMIACALICFPIFYSGKRISRPEGVLFLILYVSYTLFLILGATEHSSSGIFNQFLITVLLPTTALSIGISMMRHSRTAKNLTTSS
ncbi:MAG TPA: calcium/sodium antiporter, partial [Verrucomicrobia bacterium]|nr:calcium/sodium antiporter [Verrucomicrobiota bacterium]